MSYIKDVDLPRHAWDTPPFLLIVSPTPPVQSVDANVSTDVSSVNHVTTETKRGWPYSMSMGLSLRARASPANTTITTTTTTTIIIIIIGPFPSVSNGALQEAC